MPYVINHSIFTVLMFIVVVVVIVSAVLGGRIIEGRVQHKKKLVCMVLAFCLLIILSTVWVLIDGGFPTKVEARPERPAFIIDKLDNLVGVYNGRVFTNQRYAQFSTGLHAVNYLVELPQPYAGRLQAKYALMKVIWEIRRGENNYLFKKKVAEWAKIDPSTAIDLDQWVNDFLSVLPWSASNLSCGAEADYKNSLQAEASARGIDVWGVNIIMLDPPLPRGPNAEK